MVAGEQEVPGGRGWAPAGGQVEQGSSTHWSRLCQVYQGDVCFTFVITQGPKGIKQLAINLSIIISKIINQLCRLKLLVEKFRHCWCNKSL